MSHGSPPHDGPMHRPDAMFTGGGAGAAARTAATHPGRLTPRSWFRAQPQRTRAFRGRGWTPGRPPVQRWRLTSDQAAVLWPFLATPTPPATGAVIGWDLTSGGLFHADPAGWVLHDQIPVANPNIFVFGKPGRGKSATVKALILRLLDLGYRALVLGDPKDEYAPLCRALGIEPITLGPGLPGRINPLDLGPATHRQHLRHGAARDQAEAVLGGWVTLIRALVGSVRHGDRRVPFGPSQDVIITEVLRHLTGLTDGTTALHPVILPDVWRALHEPSPTLIDTCRYASRRHFLDETRLLRDALGQLVTGSLAGLFDAPTTIRIDGQAPIQSLSLSALDRAGDDAVGIALLCLNSWAKTQRHPDGRLRLDVRDEVWKQLRLGVGAVAALDADLRLSRSSGALQIAVAHKPSDLLTAGDRGSQAVAIAHDLLHLADIRILHGQDPATADDLDQLLGLGGVACDLVTGWAMRGTGRALWCLGHQHHQVQTVLHPLELASADTNARLHHNGIS